MLLIATKIAMLNLRGIPEMICPAYKYMCILEAILTKIKQQLNVRRKMMALYIQIVAH